jgi:hypothetical protein
MSLIPLQSIASGLVCLYVSLSRFCIQLSMRASCLPVCMRERMAKWLNQTIYSSNPDLSGTKITPAIEAALLYFVGETGSAYP